MSEKYHPFKLSLTGNLHRYDGDEGQDAHVIEAEDEFVLGLVSDGVGSHADSRVGALFVTQALRRLILQHRVTLAALSETLTPEVFGERLVAWLNRELPGELTLVAHYLGSESAEPKAVLERFLCATVLGFLVLPWTTVAFVCGDGVLLVNHTWSELRAVRENAPPLPAHHVAESEGRTGLLRVALTGATQAIHTVAIGTDGAVDLMAASRQRLVDDAFGLHSGGAAQENLLATYGNVAFPYDDVTVVGVFREAPPSIATGAEPKPAVTAGGV